MSSTAVSVWMRHNFMGFYGMPFLFARIILFLVFFGLFMGLSVTSIITNSIAPDAFFNTFLPGNSNVPSCFNVFSTY